MVGAWQDIGRISADRNFKSSTIESTSRGIWGFQEKETMSFYRTYAPIDANLEKVKKRGDSSIMNAHASQRRRERTPLVYHLFSLSLSPLFFFWTEGRKSGKSILNERQRAGLRRKREACAALVVTHRLR